MTARTTAYWVTTGLTAFIFLTSGVAELARPDFLAKDMAHIGYPVFFMTILGSWQIIGGVVVLLPRFPRLKEWAYAGMFFDLTGSAASHAAVGDSFIIISTPLILLTIAVASWALRPVNRKLRGTL